ncbi:glucose-1-phosphate cytidylyltransferase [Motilibacter rhizosphaerae]|uniref:Glucose-1-phosphate cytidylyltransferase n=1 Tax=Motilibacter rhizosphaerae TaxID=598652 RepID=A0A4Q7NPY9_9ACTN|nr:glucose-1-phosphate cytidylyltransferase [Motilibacter rhizosphaerae]RZS87394.1 glucose-1-phosphate cytidylyltransferase [Motilibacter rhizosphaerae]
MSESAATAGADAADIPVVILCGGMGTRLREASEHLPKPMVDIGGKPILWHIMKTYAHHGHRRFVLCLGYKSDTIKRYFLEYRLQASDFTLHLGGDNEPVVHESQVEEDWEITFVDTGVTTYTEARLARVANHLVDAERFMLTYGDGVADVDVSALLQHHLAAGRLATVTAVHPSSRYGEIKVDLESSSVTAFAEKPTDTAGWVNGGYFVFEREVLDKYVEDDPDSMLETSTLPRVTEQGQLSMFQHEGFWMGMDTFRDYKELNGLWDRGVAPWKVWA